VRLRLFARLRPRWRISGRALSALAVVEPQSAHGAAKRATTLEMGYADSDYIIWFGIFLPAKTPPRRLSKS